MKMSDSDDDYMSDKLLPSAAAVQASAALPKTKIQERKHKLYKQNLEAQAKKPKSSLQQEETLRTEGLSTAIGADNKGFKMLQKMGFREGSGLGKTATGIKEPINITTKKGAGGVGLERQKKENFEEMFKRKKELIQTTEVEFREHRAQQNIIKNLKCDFYKAQKGIQELDMRSNINNPTKPFYWTKQAIKLLKHKKAESGDESSYSSDSEDDKEDHTTQTNLIELIDYLRSKYFYCIYCGFAATDCEDLKESCPGPYRDEHDMD